MNEYRETVYEMNRSTMVCRRKQLKGMGFMNAWHIIYSRYYLLIYDDSSEISVLR